MAELSKPGRATSAYTSSADDRPNASIKGWSKAGSGVIAARMRSRCSSTETSGSVMPQDATGSDPLGRGGLERDVADDLDLRPERPVAGHLQGGRLAQGGSTLGEAALEVRHPFVVLRVEVDERDPVDGRCHHEVRPHV